MEKDSQAHKLNKEDAVDRSRWRRLIKDDWRPRWVWVGKCFFWYRPTRIVPDKRPLNVCVCACVRACLRACVCVQVNIQCCQLWTRGSNASALSGHVWCMQRLLDRHYLGMHRICCRYRARWPPSVENALNTHRKTTVTLIRHRQQSYRTVLTICG